ncbi:DUF3788 domain-containing protein [Hydrogenoanaerobacterium sp.]|uniref:DUF3788 domain-containing protein n=1 Tax=Hydrogenoanaerobacterium sp. TaxID=2953763 RepID=UPI0028965A65|nr:DUF3788 domain-containing protein [Hydrogenoanaerobacterium sp.]
MAWSETYSLQKQPTTMEISRFISSPLWDELCRFIEEQYHVSPNIAYSKCSMAPGWNVKYKKGGKSICTLYPSEGCFSCLVVIQDKQQVEAEFMLMGFDRHVQDIYQKTKSGMGGKWLMIDVTSEKILADLKDLIYLRMKQSDKHLCR